jgi:arylformamidase
VAATPASAEDCRIGPSPHEKGPKVWMEMDQVELDAAYDQSTYAPMIDQILKRYASASETTRSRLGAPKRLAYGPTPIEGLDLYPAKSSNAPIFVFIHGGRWLRGSARNYGFPADLFVNAGVNYIALDFIQVEAAKGDIRPMAEQVRRGIAWVYKNAASFSGDTKRFYIGGHSSGGHLCGVALVTDWQKDFALPPDMITGGLLMSGIYDLKPVRLSARSAYIRFDDDMEQSLSSIRHIDMLRAPITVTCGTYETPEFQRQSRDFTAALKDAGKPVELIEAPDFNHFEMCESFGNPYGPNGLAALKLMKLA